MARGNDPRNKSDYGTEVEAGLRPVTQSATMAPETAEALLRSDPNSNLGVTSPTAAASSSSRSVLGGGGGIGIGPAGNRMYNQDMMPAGNVPNQSRTTQVGKYGGAPIFAPIVAAPFAVFKDRLDAHARKDEEIKKALAEFDPTKGIKDSKSVRYADMLNSWGMDSIEDYVTNINERYGQEEGVNRMRNLSTPEAIGLRERVGHINAVVGSVDDAVTKAIAVTEGADKMELEVPEVLYRQAKEVQDKLGSYQSNNDPEELARILPRFQANVSLMSALENDGIGDILKNAGTTNKVFELVKSGDPLYQRQFSTLLSKKTVDRNSIVDSLTDYYARKFNNELSRADVKAMVEGMTPELYEEDVERAALPSSGGSSSGAGGASAGVGGAYQYSIIPGTQGARKFDQVRLSHISGGKGKLSAPIPLTDPMGSDDSASGDEPYVHPVAVYEDNNGELMIHGKVAKEPGTRVVADEQGGYTFMKLNKDTGEEEPISEAEYFNTLRDISVPYRDNAGALETVLPGINEAYLRSAIEKGRSGRGPGDKATAKTPPAAPAAKAASAAEYYTDQSKPPPAKGARWNAGLGMYLVPGKKPGEWVKLKK